MSASIPFRKRRGKLISGARQDALDTLSAEFDLMVTRMQSPVARRAMKSAFHTPATKLGRIAVKRARRAGH